MTAVRGLSFNKMAAVLLKLEEPCSELDFCSPKSFESLIFYKARNLQISVSELVLTNYCCTIGIAF